MPTPTGLLTVDDVTEKLGMHRDSVMGLFWLGGIYMGGRWYIKPDTLEKTISAVEARRSAYPDVKPERMLRTKDVMRMTGATSQQTQSIMQMRGRKVLGFWMIDPEDLLDALMIAKAKGIHIGKRGRQCGKA